MQRPEPSGGNPFDAYSPKEIAERVEAAGVAKAALPTLQTFVLAVLAGAFIAFGAMFFTIVVTDSAIGYGPTRLLGGIAFSLGLILVIVAGAELFTGNNLIVMAWADRRISLIALLRNWMLVFAGNAVGAVATAVLVHLTAIHSPADGALGATATTIAEAKLGLSVGESFFRGILCNTLVCLAVWLCFAARGVTDKVFAIVFPISGFVALGFEHSVANMYLIPIGLLTAGAGPLEIANSLIVNLVPVTAGNIIGGSVLVALVYWLIYRWRA